ncbi:MAG: DUF488 family protein [Parvularculaceae bacterium]|nr:DUF488 family protein [Parvularculaceae bacterium]
MNIRLKRAYEAPSKSDGRRILVERLWPRGLTKEAARIDLWLKEISPSPGLRRWFGHDPQKWPEFKRRYRAELKENSEAVGELAKQCAEGVVTFIYAAKDTERNSARVLKAVMEAAGAAPARRKQPARRK